jgi:hypothetical protein
MALTQATKVEYAYSTGTDKVFEGMINGDWSVGKVPNGGKQQGPSRVAFASTSASL